MGLGSRNPAIVGSAEEVADDPIAWVEEADIDGFKTGPHRDPREPRGLRRLGGADPAGAWRLQARLPGRHLAREAVQRVAAAVAQPPGRRAPPARRQHQAIQVTWQPRRPPPHRNQWVIEFNRRLTVSGPL